MRQLLLLGATLTSAAKIAAVDIVLQYPPPEIVYRPTERVILVRPVTPPPVYYPAPPVVYQPAPAPCPPVYRPVPPACPPRQHAQAPYYAPQPAPYPYSYQSGEGHKHKQKYKHKSKWDKKKRCDD